jgi:hypothetical protein
VRLRRYQLTVYSILFRVSCEAQAIISIDSLLIYFRGILLARMIISIDSLLIYFRGILVGLRRLYH